MSKRIAYFIFAMSFIFLVIGCGNNGYGNVEDSGESGSVDEEENIPDIDPGLEEEIIQSKDSGSEEEIIQSTDPGVDVDLTILSSTMVYSEVYNMMVTPDDYKGKIVKIKGQFVPYHDESTDKYYFSCFVSDATACCSQGIEFVLTDDYSYPEDYPGEGDTICVVGTFDTYMEDERMYCTLKEAELV